MIDLTFLYNKASEVKSVSKSYWDIAKLSIRIFLPQNVKDSSHNDLL